MKNSTHKPTESFEKQHYSKRYLERQLEEQEAEREIREYMRKPEANSPTREETPKVS